jgi:hypothetical protein
MTGAIAGMAAGTKDPQHATEAGRIAGGIVVARLRIYFAIASLVIAGVGAGKGLLPGTRRRSKL